MRFGKLASVASSCVLFTLPALFAVACGSKVYYDEPECADGLTLCSGQCVDLMTDFAHCGECDLQCFEGTCTGGVCEYTPACPPNTVECFGDCVDTLYDSNNCGGCGLICPTGVCDAGQCVDEPCPCGSLCEWFDLGSDVPQTTFWDAMGSDVWVPKCFDASGPDLVFRFVPPEPAMYYISTYGSSVPTVLSLVSPACDSLCAPPEAGGATLQIDLTPGQEVFIVVDTLGVNGVVQLDIAAGTTGCATCNQVITTGDLGNGWCPGSETLYNDFASCLCEGACATACEPLCMGGDFPPECEKCVYDTEMGCGLSLEACLNDL